MKIVGVKGDWVLVELNAKFVFYNYVDKDKTEYDKNEHAHMGMAAISKWGYLEVKPSVGVELFSAIGSKLMRKVRKNVVQRPFSF